MIKINFCDMHRGFDPYNNLIVDIIDKRIGEWELSDNPDYVFFSCSGTEHYKYDNCIKIFWTGEPVVANYNICDYAIAFPYMEYEDRYCKIPAWLNCRPTQLELTDEDLLKRRFCNFVYSNESRGTAVEFRKDFCKRLMEYKQVDCPGKVLNNMPANSISPRRGDWWQGKIDFIKNYKFTIAFENCKIPGYSTEKIEDPFIAHSIPIYWGNPMADKVYNKDSFIFVNGKEDSIEEIIEKVIYLDTHDDEYLNMVRQKAELDGYDSEINKLEDFIVHIFERENVVLPRDPLGYGRCMTIPDYRTKELLTMLGKKVSNKFKT